MKEAMFEKMERYMNGELSREDQLLFESELATNEELASAFNIYKTIETEMTANRKHIEEKTRLKKTLQQLNANYFRQRKNENLNGLELKEELPSIGSIKHQPLEKDYKNIKRIKIWKGLAVAATLVGIIALSISWYLRSIKDNPQVAVKNKKTDSSIQINKPGTTHLQENIPSQILAKEDENKIKAGENKKGHPLNNTNHEVLFAKNFKPDLAPENREGPLEGAFDYYQNRDYKDAIAAIKSADLNTVLRGQETDIKSLTFYAHYYKALSYMAVSNVVRAIPELRKAIVESPDSSFQLKAQWYLALAYLKAGDLNKTEELLREIINSNHAAEYKSKADTLISELKK